MNNLNMLLVNKKKCEKLEINLYLIAVTFHCEISTITKELPQFYFFSNRVPATAMRTVSNACHGAAKLHNTNESVSGRGIKSD